jgi:hypothetical protein
LKYLNGNWARKTFHGFDLIRAIQIPFHQNLVAIGPVVSEEKVKVYNVRRTDGRQVMAKAHIFQPIYTDYAN